MKRIWQIPYIILLTSIFTNISMADTVEFRTVVSRNDQIVDGEFHVDVEMRITSGTSPRTLNSLTVDVLYGSELAAWTTSPGSAWAFSGADGYTRNSDKLTGKYRITVTGGSVNENEGGDPPGWNVTTSFEKIVTLRWIINTATSVNINIDDGTDAAAYFENLQNEPPGNAVDFTTVTNQDLGDVTLPVELSSFSVEVESGFAHLKWTTESESNNLGFEVYRSLTNGDDYTRIDSYKSNPNLKGNGNSSTSHNYFLNDQSVEPGLTYWYKLADLDYNGVTTFHDPVSVDIPKKIPQNFELSQNYPNPFNPDTRIDFGVPNKNKNVRIALEVYDILGQRVRILVDKEYEAGYHHIIWNGRNDQNQQLASGVYFLLLKSKYSIKTQKMFLLR